MHRGSSKKNNVFRSVIKLACREGCVPEFLATIVKAFTSVLAPSMTSFMLMAFLPLSLPFFLFFFFNIHFLQMQKQHANTRMIATKAMETMAHEGTGEREQKQGRVWIKLLGLMKHCFTLQRDFRELGRSSTWTEVPESDYSNWQVRWKVGKCVMCVPTELAHRIST